MMNDERKARKLLKDLNNSRRYTEYNWITERYEHMDTLEVYNIKSQLADLPHIPNKKEAKIIRRLKKESGIKSTDEIYAKYGKQIAKELKKHE